MLIRSEPTYSVTLLSGFEWMNEWTNEWMNEWMNEWWMNEWINEWMNEWMGTASIKVLHSFIHSYIWAELRETDGLSATLVVNRLGRCPATRPRLHWGTLNFWLPWPHLCALCWAPFPITHRRCHHSYWTTRSLYCQRKKAMVSNLNRYFPWLVFSSTFHSGVPKYSKAPS